MLPDPPTFQFPAFTVSEARVEPKTKRVSEPTNDVTKLIFITMMLSGDVPVGKRCRNLLVMERSGKKRMNEIVM